jgi:hypothetical protein
MSAYNVFFKHERARMLDEQATSNWKSLGFEGMGKAIGGKWTSLTEHHERAKYKDLVKIDMTRYRSEVEDDEEKMAIRRRLDKEEIARVKRERQSAKGLNQQAFHPQKMASSAAASSTLGEGPLLLLDRLVLDQGSTSASSATSRPVQTHAWSDQLATIFAQQQYPMDQQSIQQFLAGIQQEMRPAPPCSVASGGLMAANLSSLSSSNTQLITLDSINSLLIPPQSSYHGTRMQNNSRNFLNKNKNFRTSVLCWLCSSSRIVLLPFLETT